MKSMNLLAGLSILAMARQDVQRGGGTNRTPGAKGQTEQLADTLADDVTKNDVPHFHDHVLKALLDGLSDEQIANAIRKNEDNLRTAWEAEQTNREADERVDWPGIEAFIDNELSREKFMAMIGFGVPEEEIDN